jgi:hypothetical protein
MTTNLALSLLTLPRTAKPQDIFKLRSPHKEEWPKNTNFYSWTLRLKFKPLEKAIAFADCLENQLIPHDLCDEVH